jgi:lipocalin
MKIITIYQNEHTWDNYSDECDAIESEYRYKTIQKMNIDMLSGEESIESALSKIVGDTKIIHEGFGSLCSFSMFRHTKHSYEIYYQSPEFETSISTIELISYYKSTHR